MKFSRKVGSGPVNKRLNFGGEPDPNTDPDRHQNTDSDRHQNLRRALAEVCTVPVFLVLNVFKIRSTLKAARGHLKYF